MQGRTLKRIRHLLDGKRTEIQIKRSKLKCKKRFTVLPYHPPPRAPRWPASFSGAGGVCQSGTAWADLRLISFIRLRNPGGTALFSGVRRRHRQAAPQGDKIRRLVQHDDVVAMAFVRSEVSLAEALLRCSGVAARLWAVGALSPCDAPVHIITIVISDVEYRFPDRFLYFAAHEAVCFSVGLSLPLPSAQHARCPL